MQYRSYQNILAAQKAKHNYDINIIVLFVLVLFVYNNLYDT